MKRLFRTLKNMAQNCAPAPGKTTDAPPQSVTFTGELERDIRLVTGIIGQSPDLVVRRVETGTPSLPVRAAVIYIEGLVKPERVGEHVVEPLLQDLPRRLTGTRPGNLAGLVGKHVVSAPRVKRTTSVQALVGDVLRGDTAVLLDGQPEALSCATRGYETRNVQEPILETVIRGPREGFTEHLQTNTSLLRRKLPTPDLKLEQLHIGRYSQTAVVIAYLAGVTDDELVKEVKSRVSRIDMDGILDSGYIEQLIEDAPQSLSPTVGNTEKPDVVAARLLEGRVAVLVDGSPVALTMPRLFWEVIQSPEDYYSRPYSSTMIRLIRLIFMTVTIFLPGFYIALVNYHPEMIPRTLTITLAAAQEGVPLPLAAETILLGLAFEGLREAGVRLPRPVGSAITIVGGLMIGEASVNAGLVSAPTVIVTATVGIATFLVPGQLFIVQRLALTVLASTLGFFGLVLGAAILYAHMCSLRSFGVPYMSPVAPAQYRYWRDIFVRSPLWVLDRRPEYLDKLNRRRMEEKTKPRPPVTGELKK